MHATVRFRTAARLLLTQGLLFALAAPVFADAGAAAGAWPHLRGPGLDGRVTTDGVFDQQGLGLELAWKTVLGPAYSGVSIAGGTAVTFYSDGESDLAVALDADDGRVSWTYRIDSVYRGHDGSSDGPLSSPVIHEGTVYGLGARGQLFALRLDDGRPLWVRRLTDAYGAEEPHFGFTSTPVVEGDVVIVQTGGSEGRAAALVDEYLAEHPTLPIVDGPFVHFVFQGEAGDVAIEANFIDDGADGLERIVGTDLFHRTYRLEPATRWEYRFIKDLGERVTDPRNPRTVPPSWGDVGYSELVLDGYELPAHVAEAAATAQGTVETLTFQSERLGNEREIKVYLPAGYGEGARKYPLFVVQELDWADKGRMVAALDNLIGQRVEPLVVAFVAPRDEWWLEGGGTGTEAYVDMLAEELVPFLEEKYRIEKSAEARALMGAGGFGLSAAYAALVHPRVFGKAAACSVHLGAGSGDALMQRIAQAEKSDVDFYVGWFRWDIRRHAGGLDYRGDSIELAEALAKNGYSTTGGEIRDAYGWGAAWGMTDDILVSLFPLPGDGTAAAAGSGE